MARYSQVLLTADFDRTLTGPEGAIPQRNLEAIRAFMAQGGAFTVNTGRSVPMFRQYLDKIPHNAPLLLYNGSAAYEGGELTQCHLIELDLWQTIRETAAQFPDLNLELQGVQAHYRFRENPDWDKFCDALGCDHRAASPDQALGPFLKFSLFGQLHAYDVANLFQATREERQVIDRAEAWLLNTWGDKITVFRAAPRLLDVHAKGVSKIRAARELQARLGRPILVCVGDAENDLPMLQGADYAFCPADGVLADRFPRVCPCGEGAVADVIYNRIPGLPEP